MIRQLIGRPAVYRAFNLLIGAPRVRETLVREYIRPERGQRLLDIACGIGEMVPFLPGVDYAGFDENAAYIRAARAQHPAARFTCERIADHEVRAGQFDLALAAGVLHHLDDDEALVMLRVAHASLRPGGRAITLDPCFVDGQPATARWLATRDRGQHVRSQDGYLQLMRAVFPTTRATLRTDLLRVPYTHLIVECARAD